jgi:predicted nucleic acid-binding protein
MKLVLIDTCSWAPFFNRRNSAEHRAISRLLHHDRALLTGPIVAEVLQGFRNEAQARYVASLLRGVSYEEPTWADWQEAARLSRRLAANHHQLPLSDLVIAALSIRIGAEIYTSDPHFDLISGVTLFRA